KGLVYAAIDTSKNEKYKSLEAEPYKVALKSWEESKKLEDGKSSVYVTDANGLPQLPAQSLPNFAQAYFSTAIAAYDKEKNYKKALDYVEKTLYFIPEDTAVILNAGIVFAPAAEEYDKSISFINQYFAKGGKSADAYTTLYAIYRDKKKDNDKALKITQEAIAKHPKNTDFPKLEFDMFVAMNRLPEAKASLEKQVKTDPTDAQAFYFLGLISNELKDPEGAKKSLEAALKLDPAYVDAQIALAEIVYLDAKAIKQQMSQLGISAQDKQKKIELDKVLVEKEKVALPYWETAEKLDPENEKVLLNLLGLYQDLGMDAKLKPLVAKMKKLGLVD
ncbi:MAG TPA: tetratricopeptide repeat protein, partial [Cyclobacteriaceae bacterium]|nr:tetratricopeptide repeat protein [Cyclobacteriaceae bacterium]